MSIKFTNLTECNNSLIDYINYLQQKKQSKGFQTSNLQIIREFFKGHKSFIGASDVDGTVLFLKLVKQLKNLTKVTDEESKGEDVLAIAKKQQNFHLFT